jgi:hypothetical protein
VCSGETFFPDADEWFVSTEPSPDFGVSDDGTRLNACVSSVVQEDCADPTVYGHIAHAQDDDDVVCCILPVDVYTTHSLTYSLTLSHTHSHTHKLTHSHTHSLTNSLTHTHTHSHTHLLTYSPSH